MKNKILTLILILSVSNIWAQDFSISKQVNFGGSGPDYLNSVVLNSGNTFLVAGSSYSDIGFDITWPAKGSEDILILKYDLDYNLLWGKRIGGSNSDKPVSLIELSDGQYLLGATSKSQFSGDKTVPCKGNSDYWLLKLDIDGNIIWQKGYGTHTIDVLTKVIELPDGSLIAAGTSYGGATGDKTEGCKGNSDYWILKLDANGEKIWDKTIGSAAYDQLGDVLIDESGNVYLVGDSKGEISGDKTETCFNNSDDIWIVKLNSENGAVIWDKTIGSNGSDAFPTSQYHLGHLYVACGSSGGIGGLKTEPNINLSGSSTDIWLFKLDTVGNLLWDKTMGGNDFERPKCLKVINDSKLLICSVSSSGASGNKSEDGYGADSPYGAAFDNWLLEVDTAGQVIWEKTIGTKGHDIVRSALILGEQQFIIAGQSNSTEANEWKTVAGNGGEDIWLYTLDVTQGIEDKDLAEGVYLYPNPSRGHLSFRGAAYSEISIHDLSGREVYASKQEQDIDLSAFPDGIYIAKIVKDKKVYTQKIILSK